MRIKLVRLFCLHTSKSSCYIQGLVMEHSSMNFKAANLSFVDLMERRIFNLHFPHICMSSHNFLPFQMIFQCIHACKILPDAPIMSLDGDGFDKLHISKRFFHCNGGTLRWMLQGEFIERIKGLRVNTYMKGTQSHPCIRSMKTSSSSFYYQTLTYTLKLSRVSGKIDE